jgi:hypothetical protein
MSTYGILTRYGHYFEVTAHDEDHAREEAETDIAAGDEAEDGDAVHQINLIGCPIQGIRDDLAEIMAS